MAYVSEMHPESLACTRRFTTVGSDKGIFAPMLIGLAAGHGEEKTFRIDATFLKTYRTASSLGVERGCGRLIGQTKGYTKTELHPICKGQGRPLDLFVIASRVCSYVGTRTLAGSLGKVDWLPADRGYDAE
jgi:hypothetical protein